MITIRLGVGASVLLVGVTTAAFGQTAGGASNPLIAESTLPFHAPPFDRIKDSDYQPAIEAGIEAERTEVLAIANNAAPASFENTIVALAKSGRLLQRAQSAFGVMAQANTNPELQKVRTIEAPKLAALNDEETLNPKLFARVKTVYDTRASLELDPEGMRLVELTYEQFTRAGANLGETDKARLKEINGRISVLSNEFNKKLLAGAKAASYSTTDKGALAGMTDSEIAAAAGAAKARKVDGYVLPLQNTTQQPALESLSNRATREAVFAGGWTRNERGDENDTRASLTEIAKLRAERAKLLGYPNFASWKLTDQMAKTPEAVQKFMDALVPAATAKAVGEGKDIQAVIDAQKGGFALAAYDWDFYAEQVRKAKYDLDEAAVKPYFELDRVLQDGVFYAATRLYGITFKQRKDIPVYHPEVKVYEVTDADGKPLALFYCDWYKRDNKQGGAWTGSFVGQSKLLGTMPVIYNVGNLPKPAPGESALITSDDVRTMFHEFGHALHAMFSSVEYPGQGMPRDFVEFPSQFNEHWANDPEVFAHYARHYKTGAAMPAELVAKLKTSATFNQGYALTELLAAAELDMQWHLLSADAPVQDADAFEAAALKKTGVALDAVPPRYRSSYFSHIWESGYSAGYYAYLWSEMLDDDAYAWFGQHGGLTRANGDRLRKMVLSRWNTEDLETMYERWRGGPPTIDGMVKQRGLIAEGSKD